MTCLSIVCKMQFWTKYLFFMELLSDCYMHFRLGLIYCQTSHSRVFYKMGLVPSFFYKILAVFYKYKCTDIMENIHPCQSLQR